MPLWLRYSSCSAVQAARPAIDSSLLLSSASRRRLVNLRFFWVSSLSALFTFRQYLWQILCHRVLHSAPASEADAPCKSRHNSLSVSIAQLFAEQAVNPPATNAAAHPDSPSSDARRLRPSHSSRSRVSPAIGSRLFSRLEPNSSSVRLLRCSMPSACRAMQSSFRFKAVGRLLRSLPWRCGQGCR